MAFYLILLCLKIEYRQNQWFFMNFEFAYKNCHLAPVLDTFKKDLGELLKASPTPPAIWFQATLRRPQ